MNQPIIIVSGSEGRVGKSLTTMALLDYSLTNHKYVKLIDADTNNPDVGRCYGRLTEGEIVDLDDVEGWIRLVNLCDASPFKAVVINTPAQSNRAVSKHAGILLDSLRELARPMMSVVTRQRNRWCIALGTLRQIRTGPYPRCRAHRYHTTGIAIAESCREHCVR